MKKLLSDEAAKEIVYVNDCRELKGVQGLANKRLCIIKTNFKDINKIKKICKSYPNLEVWVACEEISRKNIITANMCGIKNIIQYPVKEEVINDLLNNTDLTRIKEKSYLNNKYNFEDLSFTLFKATYLQKTGKKLEESDFISFGLMDDSRNIYLFGTFSNNLF